MTVIEPARGLVPINLRALWGYRELLYFLVWRDIKVRYRQTLLGVAWAVIQPVLMMAVLTVFFGSYVRVPTDGAPYAAFAYAGLLPWGFFAGAVTRASQSLVLSQHLITKVYFPRLVIPIAAILSGLLDLAIACLALVPLLMYFGTYPRPARLVLLPVFVVVAILTALATGLWLSALNVRYRDVGHLVPVLVQIWMFASPIVYPATIVPARYQALYAMNPLVGVVGGFRWALLGAEWTSLTTAPISGLVVMVLLVSGAYYFRRVERTFADAI